jgi:hypothetical protein
VLVGGLGWLAMDQRLWWRGTARRLCDRGRSRRGRWRGTVDRRDDHAGRRRRFTGIVAWWCRRRWAAVLSWPRGWRGLGGMGLATGGVGCGLADERRRRGTRRGRRWPRRRGRGPTRGGMRLIPARRRGPARAGIAVSPAPWRGSFAAAWSDTPERGRRAESEPRRHWPPGASRAGGHCWWCRRCRRGRRAGSFVLAIVVAAVAGLRRAVGAGAVGSRLR